MTYCEFCKACADGKIVVYDTKTERGLQEMKAKALNLKNMKEALVNHSGYQEELSEIWNVFYRLTLMGFISWETWRKFSEQCRGWYYDEYCDCIRDERHCQEGVDNIVWKYTPDADYHA